MTELFTYPFSFDFMRYAFMAIVIITPLLGLLGAMVVHKKMAYFSDALGHSALTGIAAGVIFGISNTNLVMMVFGALFALLLNHIKFKNLQSVDVIISVFASASLAVGLAILSHGGNFSKYSSLMVGDVLSVSKREVIYMAAVFCFAIVLWIIGLNTLVASSVNQTLGRVMGLKVRLFEDVFSVLIAVIVMISIKWIGILLINALFILPAAASKNISENMREYHLYSVIFALFSGVMGLFISFYVNVATGPLIVIFAAVIYFATYLYGRKMNA